jgi:hypothetical protein
MNYRRKKISMKERFEEAIEENGDEPLQCSGFERQTPEEGFIEIEPGTPAASCTLKPPVGAQYRHV